MRIKLIITIFFCFLNGSFVVQEVFGQVEEFECDCQRNEQYCTRSGKRVRGIYNIYERCNGVNDCGDWTDENNCHYACKARNQITCDCQLHGNCNRDNLIFSWPCYLKHWRCDQVIDCPDESDEMNCNYTCGGDQHECDCHKNGGICSAVEDDKVQCYEDKDVCDEDRDCADYSDERNCTCDSESKKCGCILKPGNCTSNLGCVDIDDILDGSNDCEDGSDEPCEIEIVNSRRLVPYYSYDEHEVDTTILFLCNESSQRYYMELKGGGRRKCKQIDLYSSETFTRTETKWICLSDYYIKNGLVQCKDKGWVTGPNLCNGFPDCADGSDELYDVPGFKCKALNAYQQHKQSCVLAQSNLQDNNSYCEDKSDICYVYGKLKCFKCLDGKLLLSPMQVCDGVVDCYDASDECLCENQTICNEVLGDSADKCPIGQLLCSGQCLSSEQVICNKSANCSEVSNMKHCSKTKLEDTVQGNGTGYVFCPTDRLSMIYTNATMCNGIPECYNRGDECNAGCPNQTHFCDVNLICHQDQASAIWESEGRLFHHKREYCDGIPLYHPLCKDGFDETNCEHRYYCHNTSRTLHSIGDHLLCDGVPDCTDGSDELESECSDRRFYCKSKQPLSVSRDRVENGIKDCSDGSDECPPVSTKDVVFSSPFEMIGSTFFRVIFWVMGFVALVGNVIVFISSVLELKTGVRMEPIKISFHAFLLNLAVSDSLMGIYLLAISGIGVQFSGSYCHHDAQWRSSSRCSFLGTLVVISTQVSALIMAALATFRLISVYFPIKMKYVKKSSYIGSAISAWVIGVLLGCIPSMSQSGYFVNTLWFPNYFFAKQEVPKSKVYWLAKRAFQLMGNTTTPKDWIQVKETIKHAFMELEIKGEFGYFGATSVCMPKLFVNVGDDAWEYSAFLITFNFILFIYIALAYICLFRKSRKSLNKRNKMSKKLLETVFTMILSNFCCWIPICLLGFISLSGVHLDKIVYVVSAGLLLPINSVLNPLIYSKVALTTIQKMWKK